MLVEFRLLLKILKNHPLKVFTRNFHFITKLLVLCVHLNKLLDQFLSILVFIKTNAKCFPKFLTKPVDPIKLNLTLRIYLPLQIIKLH